MNEYEVHEWIAENVAEDAPMIGLGVPDKVIVPEGNDSGIPAGIYTQDENGTWTLDS